MDKVLKTLDISESILDLAKEKKWSEKELLSAIQVLHSELENFITYSQLQVH